MLDVISGHRRRNSEHSATVEERIDRR